MNFLTFFRLLPQNGPLKTETPPSQLFGAPSQIDPTSKRDSFPVVLEELQKIGKLLLASRFVVFGSASLWNWTWIGFRVYFTYFLGLICFIYYKYNLQFHRNRHCLFINKMCRIFEFCTDCDQLSVVVHHFFFLETIKNSNS